MFSDIIFLVYQFVLRVVGVDAHMLSGAGVRQDL